MTTYNTGNPIGSTDPKDLYDNAEAFDRAINDSAATFTDRLGNERPTLKRLEVDYPLAGVYADQAALSAENAQLAATGAVAAQASAVSAKLAADAALAGIQGEADEIAANAAASATAIAVSAKDGAVIAKTAAEAARDATVVGAAPTVYASTAAGLAATISGKYFSVPSADSAEYLILYLNNAGVAEPQKRYPSSEIVKNLAAPSVGGVEYAIQDSNDNASEYIEPGTGKHCMLSVDADSVNGVPRYRLNKATRSAPKLNASIVHHISYGQSLALGNGSGDVHTLPGGDADGFFDSVMFNANGVTTAGPRAQEGSGTAAQNHASLIPYLEQPLSGAAPNGNCETPLGNAMRTVKRLLRDEDGIKFTDFDYILLGSAPGQSNTAIAGLAKGSTPYTNLISDVTYGLTNSQAAGKIYCVDVVYFSQGERDIQLGTARLTYKNALLQLYTDLNTDIKAVTGQAHDIKIVMYQCTSYQQFTGGFAGANIALAQLDAAKANSNIILATSVYALEHITGTNLHLSAAGYANLGGYYGLAAKRAVVDGSQWANLYPTRLTRQGAIVEIEFPDTGYPIAASSALFPIQTNYGLTAVGVDGVTDNPIVSVAVTAPRRVRVVLTNALPGYLRYGFASWGGNLHDNCDIDPGAARSLTLYRPVLTFDEAFQ